MRHCRRLLVALAASVVAMSLATPAARATYPGSNGKIAFTSRTGGDPQIWTMTSNGHERTRLTGPARPNFHPGFHANGKRMVFISTTPSGVHQIFEMNDDGNLRTQITTGDRNFGDAAISPDDKWVVAAGWRGDNPKNLWLVRADGSGSKRFTKALGDDLGPSFSPDGTKIVWTRFRPDGSSDIYVKDLDGGKAKKLTDSGTDKGPSFSPDGTRIVYTHMIGTKNTGRLWVMNADGTGRSKRTDNPVGTMFDHAIWSPDGDKIGFIRERDAGHVVPEIFVINVAGGGGLENLTDGRFEPIDFDWGVG